MTSPQPPRRSRSARAIAAATLAILLGIQPVVLSPARAQRGPGLAEPARAAPEAASGFSERGRVQSRQAMVATANPLASEAAQRILRRGGHALDAAIAAQMVLGLVEPQSSGIGGGGFLMLWQADQRRLLAWDGRETAPAAADERLFLAADGTPLPFFRAVVGGRSVGTPGLVRMLEAAHRESGRLPWPELMTPAIALAEHGFAASARLVRLARADPALDDDPVAARYFGRDGGPPLTVGTLLRNPELAGTLRQLAAHGADALHTGPLAGAIVDKVRRHGANPGLLSIEDLAGYRPLPRDPLCRPWQRWIVCGMPPPSAGTVTLLQMLGMLAEAGSPPLSTRDSAGRPALSLDGVHRFSEAGRLAFADRDRYLADPAFVPWPAGLLDPGYLRQRAALIGPGAAGIRAPGQPPGLDARAAYGAAATQPESGTTHLSIVDADGNAVSMTTTIESAFGSRQWVGGFLLNNQLTDFSFLPADPATGAPVANRVEGGKRPRSSMAPLLVFDPGPDDARQPGRLVMVTGSPGGSAIINYVARTLLATLQDGLDPQQAISLPNIGNRNGPTELELGRVDPALAAALRARGHRVREIEMTSGIQSIVRQCDRSGRRCGWQGAADPRREGLVLGD